MLYRLNIGSNTSVELSKIGIEVILVAYINLIIWVKEINPSSYFEYFNSENVQKQA